jgi:hypothetical protein
MIRKPRRNAELFIGFVVDEVFVFIKQNCLTSFSYAQSLKIWQDQSAKAASPRVENTGQYVL